MNALQQVLQMLIDTPGGVEAMAEVLNEPDCPVIIKDGHFIEKSQINSVDPRIQITQAVQNLDLPSTLDSKKSVTQKEPNLQKNTFNSTDLKTENPAVNKKILKPVTESFDDIKSKLESLQETDEVLTIRGPQGAEFPYLKIKANPKFENMYLLWGEDEKGNIYNKVKYSTLQNTIFQIKNYKEQTMTESVKSNQETDIIYYRGLPVDINTGNPGGYYDDSFGNWLPDDRYVTHYIDWEYELPKEDIIEALGDFLSEEEDKQLSELSDDEFWAYVEQHYDELFKKYETRLEDKFREAATEDATENIDWDFYDEPDYDDIDECLSSHYDDEGHYIFKDFRDAADVELKEFWDEPKDQHEEEFKPVDTQLEMEGLDATDPTFNFTEYEWKEQDPEDTQLDWEEVASKDVFGADGFLTTYKWFKSVDPAGNETHIFMFNDDEANPDYADYECHDAKEAQEWFNSYEGLEEEDPDFDDVVLEDEPAVEDFKAQDCLTESYMNDLSVDMQEAGGKERLVKSLERQVLALQSELEFLKTIAPREIGAGGNFDSVEEVEEAVTQTEKALRTVQAKLGVLKEGK